MFASVSSTVSDVYVEYVPRPVPRAPRTFEKRGRADSSSSALSAAKKSRQSSTHPGTPVVAIMLLGEHINTLPFCCLFLSLTEYFCPFSAGAMVALVESEEEEDDDAALVTHR